MQIRVLVVEDDSLQAEILAATLQSQGFYVEVADTAVTAVQTIRTGWFDLVLMDYGLPEIDGLVAARLIATLTKATGRPRLVALTASPERVAGTAQQAGHVFDAVIAKPYTLDVLVATLRRCHEQAPPAVHGWLDPAAEIGSRLDGLAQASEPGPPEGGLRVLVAEDDELWRSAVVEGLKRRGHHVDSACDGLEALRDVSECPYDIAVMDYRLPEIDGVAAARLIFDIVNRARRPRLIALTGAPELLREHLASQADMFDMVVPKSAGMPGLLAAFERCEAYVRRPRPDTPVSVMRLASTL